MAEIVLGEPLASQLRQAAETQGVEVEELIRAAIRHANFEAQRRKIDRESEWWESAALELRRQYPEGFVAVHDHRVVDHDLDEEALHQRVRAAYGNTAVLITHVDGPRTYRIVSTRLEPL